jgi:hypothetical protein
VKSTKRKRGKAAKPLAVGSMFARGFVASGLLAAIQGRSGTLPARIRVVRHAIQGGAALAAGSVAARAIRRRDYGQALAAVAAGATAMLAAERFLTPAPQPESMENGLGQEEA